MTGEKQDPLDLAAIEDNLLEVLVYPMGYKSPQHKMLDNQRLLIEEVKRLRDWKVALIKHLEEDERHWTRYGGDSYEGARAVEGILEWVREAY